MPKKIIKLLTLSLIVFTLGVLFVGLNTNSIYDTKNLTGQKLKNVNLEHFNEDRIITEIDLKKNNFTLINFWASWCAPCRDEHPFLLKLNNEINLKIIGVNFKDKKKNAINFLKNYGNPYDDLARDEFGKQSINFGVYGIPESILVNKDLLVIKKFIGPINNTDMNIIKKIIGEL